MDFYGIVIIIATCFLIVCLIIMGIIMQNMNSENPFPPTINPCPDTWTVKGNSCAIPQNINVGSISAKKNEFLLKTYGIRNPSSGLTGSNIINPLDGQTVIDFSDGKWSEMGNGSDLCSKIKWTTEYGISWDGVSNNTGSGCP